MSNLSSVPTQMRDQFQLLLPPWLNNGNGEKFGYTLSVLGDRLLEKWFQAACIRIPGAGDVSQIPYLCKDRGLVQGPAESVASIATRLQQAFQVAKLAGGRIAVARELQAYLQNLQPGVSGALPEFTIVAGNASVTTWSTQYVGDALGVPPSLMTVPTNFNWDGTYKPWRSWLILYMSAVPTGQSGSSAATGVYPAPTYIGSNVGGVWTPGGSSGPTVQSYMLPLTGLAGLSAANVGNMITITGSSHGNNGTFQIASVQSATACTIASTTGSASDAGPLIWSISAYPYIAPGPCWGTPGVAFGQGQQTPPPVTLGQNAGGVWVPASPVGQTYGTSVSWGLSCSPQVIQSIRLLLQRWKSATTYYPQIIVAFDGATGAAGSAYSPNSTEGDGNPDGTFGSVGALSSGVWVPTRKIFSTADCYCQGTGSTNNCTVENVT